MGRREEEEEEEENRSKRERSSQKLPSGTTVDLLKTSVMKVKV